MWLSPRNATKCRRAISQSIAWTDPAAKCDFTPLPEKPTAAAVDSSADGREPASGSRELEGLLAS